jgi:hypothetical protein
MDTANAGVGVRRAHYHRVDHAGNGQVVGESAATGKKAVILLSRQRLSDPFLQAGQDKLNRCPTA